jgi:hypothetical protein
MAEYFLFMCEYGPRKPLQVILRRIRVRGRIMEGMNQTGVHCSIYGNVIMKPL